MAIILSENFDGVTAPALPATLSFGVGFETTTNSPSSSPNALRNTTTGQKDSYTLVKDGVNGDSSVSADVSFTAVGGSDAARLFLRSAAQSFANQYFASFAGSGALNLWYRDASTSTQLGSTVAAGALTNNAKYNLSFRAIGDTLTVRLVRNSDGFYLNSSGTFQVGAADAITQTHASLNGQQGYSGITIVGAAANRTQVDNFVFTSEAAVQVTQPIVTAFDENGISLSVTASGGTSPYSYQWYLKDAANDALSGANDVVGATTATPTITLSDGLSATVIKYVECQVTDSAGSPGTVDSGSIPVLLGTSPAPLKLCFFGDSIGRTPNGTTDNFGFYAAKVLEGIGGLRTVTLLNGHISGSDSSNGAAGWGPTATSAANAGDNATLAAEGAVRYLTALKNVVEDTFGVPDRSTNPVYVCCSLGRNDALGNVAAATFGTQIDAIVDDLITFGVYVVLDCPIASAPSASSWADSKTDLVYAYQAQLQALANGTTIFEGDMTCFALVGMRHTDLLVDNIHPNTTGAKLMGAAKAQRLAEILELTEGSGGSVVVARGRLVNA